MHTLGSPQWVSGLHEPTHIARHPSLPIIESTQAMANARITVEVSDENLLNTIDHGINQLEKPHELMRMVAGNMLAAVEDNFEDQGRPKWVGLQQGTIEQRERSGHWPGKILQRSGRLKNSISQHWDDRQAIVGTNLIYAAIQQFGGKTKPHTIKPKNKKALAFAGRVLRSVKHPGSNIPARPFLALTQQDLDDLVHDVNDWYAGLFLQGR